MVSVGVGLMFAVSLPVFALGIILFLAGFHDLDSSWNMKVVNLETGASYCDRTTGGMLVCEDEGILIGYRYMFTGFALLLSLAACQVVSSIERFARESKR